MQKENEVNISLEDFLEYFKIVSATYEKDEAFEQHIKTSWKNESLPQ